MTLPITWKWPPPTIPAYVTLYSSHISETCQNKLDIQYRISCPHPCSVIQHGKLHVTLATMDQTWSWSLHYGNCRMVDNFSWEELLQDVRYFIYWWWYLNDTADWYKACPLLLVWWCLLTARRIVQEDILPLDLVKSRNIRNLTCSLAAFLLICLPNVTWNPKICICRVRDFARSETPFIGFNPRMDKWLHSLWCGMKLLIHSQSQQRKHWSLPMENDSISHFTGHVITYLNFKLIHFSERGPFW